MSNLFDDNGIFALFQGGHGTGKSTAAMSFPTIYVFDCDRKMPNIAKKAYPNRTIPFGTYKTVFDVHAKIDEFEYECPFESLLIDSVTGLGGLSIETTNFTKGGPIAKDFKTKAKRGVQGWDYYQNELADIEEIVNRLKVLQLNGKVKHVIFTAHIMEFESNLDTKQIVRTQEVLARGKKAGKILPTLFDDLYLFGLDKGFDKAQRFCMTEGLVGDDLAKCSWPFPDKIYLKQDKLFYEQLLKEDEGKFI